MSRETDSSSSGPQGRGGAAYPSGTPPYGTRPFPSLHPQERPRPADAPGGAPEADAPDGAAGQGGPSQAADEPKTETTLTTRIRINIPGSRPIPPVVVRTPVDESTVRPDAAPAAAEPEPAAPAAEAEPEKQEPSDWFAPRKPAAGGQPGAGGQPASGGQPGAAPETGAGRGAGRGTAPGAPAPGPGPQFGGEPGGGEPGGRARDFGPAAGGPRGGGGFGAPAPGADPFAEAFTSPPADPQAAPPRGERPPAGRPMGAPPLPERPAADRPSGPRHRGAHNDGQGGGFGGDTGTQPIPHLPPPVGPQDGGPGPRGPRDTPPAGAASPFGTQDFPPGVPRPSDPYGEAGSPAPDAPFPGYQPPAGPPAGPTAGPVTGPMQVPSAGGPAAPPRPGPAAGPGTGPGGQGGFPPPADRVAGDTLVSGIPAVPAGETRGPRPAPAPAPERIPAPAPERVAAASSGQRKTAPKKKGRSKLVLLAVAAGGVLVLAYGAGLLMNHADVPKGTTVLGVDIGNMNQDAAVQTLDKALGNRATAPITLTIGGRKQLLKPSVAGLSVDTDTTVRNVAHADYNPVSVIGSLFGGSRTAAPVYLVDGDKLKAALGGLAGRSSSGSDGKVTFADHKAIAVPGKPGTSFDVDSAATQVAAAYRTRAETGADQPVALAVRTVPPRVGQAALDKAVNGFGRTAMQGPVTVRADAAHQIPFNNTLPQFLTMVPDQSGTLQPHIDLGVLKSLYGSKFDGVLLRRSGGGSTPVTPQDVATALVKALGSSTERTVTLPGVVG
ncbi:hypothetical protein V2S66_15745 [Streptomyces sp. V4-01]|uniref:Peptidoglycan binding domain-containing protein n=1 Tax=Actinacidiphila polyblastidii TaxID=3110430 RepID=A0ABU7PC83_9ACTN|nr:hypothetical protein [Streptomyces sp. V4-01]